jgi:hypothetical protein
MKLLPFLLGLVGVLCEVGFKAATAPRVAPRQYGTMQYPQDIH